jgi:hypothetical protein
MNKKHLLGYLATAVIALTIGAAGASGSTAAAEVPTPTPTATVTVPGPTETVTVEKTPASCLTALDLADKGFGFASEGFSAASDALTAVSNMDVAGIEDANVKLGDTAASFGTLAPEYAAAKAECRAATT